MKLPLLTLGLLFGQMTLHGSDVRMRVVDETGAPVTKAQATIIFGMTRYGADKVHTGLTDKEGVFRAKGQANHSVMIKASKEGYYEGKIERLQKDKNHDLPVVLPRVLKPLPLRAYVASIGGLTGYITLPTHGEWLGFDLEAGDWVAPHGKGKVTDIRFRFRNEFKGYSSSGKNLERSYELSKKSHAARKEEWTEEKFRITAGKWDAELDISFPGEKEGLVEVTDKFLPYSQLKMPHEAPAQGYLPSWRCTAKNYAQPPWRIDVGFFLRTRVKLGEKDNIVSAHYSKVMGDFYVFPAGGISFTYYFNPTSNDRNLEFDPKKNLFPKNAPGANVFHP